MRLGMLLNYAADFRLQAEEVFKADEIGVDVVYVPEAYAFDSASQLGYLAARTQRIELASGVMPLYTRTPSLLAMTAAGIDYLSEGRFTLGIGAGGPQVMEGFHGVPFDAPLQRTREIVEICRQVWRREHVRHSGRKYTIPLPPDQGLGLGKPLKLINHPVRDHIPIMIAALGPKNVAMAAEIADSWNPFLFSAEKSSRTWGDSLAEGARLRSPELPPLDIAATVPVAIGDDTAAQVEAFRHLLALYVGGMGAAGTNFYFDLACEYGYADDAHRIQQLYLDGKKFEAAAVVPHDLVHEVAIIGDEQHAKERVAAYADAGVTTLVASLIDFSSQARLETMTALRRCC